MAAENMNMYRLEMQRLMAAGWSFHDALDFVRKVQQQMARKVDRAPPRLEQCS